MVRWTEIRGTEGVDLHVEAGSEIAFTDAVEILRGNGGSAIKRTLGAGNRA